jgi:hypothetical protein
VERQWLSLLSAACLALASPRVGVAQIMTTTETLSVSFSCPPTLPQDDSVWYWSETCGAPSMVLDVLLDTTLLLRTRFPICKIIKDSSAREGAHSKSRVDFSFIPERTVVWHEYGGGYDTTLAQDTLLGSVWFAGGNHEEFACESVFRTVDRKVAESLHFGRPNAVDTSDVAYNGLLIVTYPVTGEK